MFSPPSLLGKGVGGLGSSAAALLLFAFALFQALGTNNLRDFYIFRLGAELAARGENPYDVPKVRQHIAAQFSDESAKEFVDNSGYFLPPLAVLLFMSFAVLPWASAKVAWAVAIGLAGYFVARLPGMRSSDSPLGVLPLLVVPFVLLLNPLALAVVVVGQYTLVFVGCVAAGFSRLSAAGPISRQAVGAAVREAAPRDPAHSARVVPRRWKPAALLVGLVGLLNLAGATVVGGSPLFLRDYLNYLPTAREVVAFNRVEMNPNITSWNRLLFAWGGPLVELSAVTIVAGYLVWFGLIVGRCAATNTTPSGAWAAAAAAVGAVFFAQVLVYELLFLAVAVPWVRDLFAGGYRFRGWLAVLLMAVQLLPGKVFEPLRLADFYHSLAVALLAVLVLIGPAQAPRSPLGRG